MPIKQQHAERPNERKETDTTEANSEKPKYSPEQELEMKNMLEIQDMVKESKKVQTWKEKR